MHLYLKSFERYTKSSLFFLAVATCNITAALAPLLILACFFVSDKFVYKQCAQTNTIFQVHYLNNLMLRFLFLFRLSFLAAAVAILTLQHHSYDFFLASVYSLLTTPVSRGGFGFMKETDSLLDFLARLAT